MSSLVPPSLKTPAFDNTLGALFIGYSVATILYGVGCLQVFIYLTTHLSALESAHQLALTAGIYRFLVTDYLNPLALGTGGPGSGEIFIYAIISVFVQLFFCWRIWIFSGVAFTLAYRIAFLTLTVSLALFSFGSNIDVAITGFNHRLLSVNTPEFILAFKLATTSQVAFDVIMTVAMMITLHRAQSNIRSTKHVIVIIMLFTVNTNLLSTIISISALATFLSLPNATVYGGLGFLLGKSYFNAFFAILNSREFLSEKLAHTTVTLDHLPGDSSETTATGYEMATVDMSFRTNSEHRIQKSPGIVRTYSEEA
ncbi:hypothetical protein BJ912DRAFT_933557 [Pholiota molesta]|nr:hypothetical protein BJ912DRAFT_933557 [Pholiota molesta]